MQENTDRAQLRALGAMADEVNRIDEVKETAAAQIVTYIPMISHREALYLAELVRKGLINALKLNL